MEFSRAGLRWAAAAVWPVSVNLPARQPDTMPFALASRLLAYVFLLIGATAVFANILHPYRMDFVGFWASGSLAVAGHAAAAYDIAAHNAVQQAAESYPGVLPFPYPPPYLLILVPFALLPYPLAALAWIVTTGGLYIGVMRRLFPTSRWHAAAFTPVVANLVVGQSGFFCAALFAGGVLLLPRRPFVAGLVFGLLIMKPHLAVLLPLAFIAGRQWQAFAGAACGAIGALLVALLVFGPEPYGALFQMIPLYDSIMRDGLVPWHKMASVYAALSGLGLTRGIALAVHGAVALMAAAVVWRVWRSDGEMMAKAAALAAATLLVSPYLFSYDMLILVIPLLWLLGRGERGLVITLAWLLPLTSVLQDWGLYARLYPLPVVSAAVLFLVWRHVRHGSVLSVAEHPQYPRAGLRAA